MTKDYIYTDKFLKRTKQVEKVYDYYEKAYNSLCRFGFFPDSGPATKWLKKLRDYLNKEFPEKRRKHESLG